MAVCKVGRIPIFPGRAPLPEVYSSMFRNLRIAYANEIQQSSAEVMLAHGGIEADRVVAFPNSVVWRVIGVLSETALAPRLQMRGLETISTT